MSINLEAFSPSIRQQSGFQDFITLAESSPTLSAFINSFATGAGIVDVSQGGTSTTGLAQILVGTADLPVAGDPGSLLRFASALSHELGHATMPGGYITNIDTLLNARTAEAAVKLQLQQEGIATYLEYLVSQELGYTIRGGAQLDQSLDALAKQYGVGSMTFKNAAIELAASNYSNIKPSTAPNFTYAEYYEDGWYALKAGLDPNDLNWTSMQASTIQTSIIDGGFTRVFTTGGLKDGGYSTTNFTMDMNAAGNVINEFKSVETYDGFRYAQVTGTGSYYLNDTIVTLTKGNNGLYASIIGDGNDIYVTDGNEIRLTGHGNYMVSAGVDSIYVSGTDNVLAFSGFPDAFYVDGVAVPDYLGSISYVGGNAYGNSIVDLNWGSNFYGYDPMYPYWWEGQHKGTGDHAVIALPGPAAITLIGTEETALPA